VIKALDPLGGLAPQQLHLVDGDAERGAHLHQAGALDLARHRVQQLLGDLPEAGHQGGLLLGAHLCGLGVPLALGP
jgi:hypothetical protein